MPLAVPTANVNSRPVRPEIRDQKIAGEVSDVCQSRSAAKCYLDICTSQGSLWGRKQVLDGAIPLGCSTGRIGSSEHRTCSGREIVNLAQIFQPTN